MIDVRLSSKSLVTCWVLIAVGTAVVIYWLPDAFVLSILRVCLWGWIVGKLWDAGEDAYYRTIGEMAEKRNQSER